MTDAERRIKATHALDQLDGAMAELAHWFATGERVTCPACTQLVPAVRSGVPGRHKAGGQWCTPPEKATAGR